MEREISVMTEKLKMLEDQRNLELIEAEYNAHTEVESRSTLRVHS